MIDEPVIRHLTPRHPEEFARLTSVSGLLLPLTPDPFLDAVARQAADLCGSPIGVVTVVEEAQIRIVGRAGVDLNALDREGAFCAFTILEDEPLVVEDAEIDPRFAGTPLVSSGIRTYAGAAMLDALGLPLGTVCALGTKPQAPSSSCVLALRRLATMTGVVMEARRVVASVAAPELQPEKLLDAYRRLDAALTPLFDRANGFRPV